MSQQHKISEFTQAALENLKTLIDADTVIGNPITTPAGVVIIPVSKVAFGYGSGGADLPGNQESFGGGTGGGVTINPIAFLVVNGNDVKLLQMTSANNTADRVVNSIPEIIDKLGELIPKKDKKKAEEE